MSSRLLTSSARKQPAGNLGQLWLRLRWFAGRTLAVRAKLTIWYALVSGVTLGVVGLGMAVAINHQIDTAIDGSLARTEISMADHLARPILPANPSVQPCPQVSTRVTLYYCEQLQTTLNDYSARVSSGGQFEQVVVLDPTVPPAKTFTLYSPFAPGRAGLQGVQILPYIPAEVAGTGRPRYITVPAYNDSFRVYVAVLPPPRAMAARGVITVLEVFQSRHVYLDIEGMLRLIVLVGIPFAVLLALLSGWWIARVALRPINRIATKVQSIGESRDLSRRLEYIGPRDEVGRLADTFDAMMARLERAFESQRRFIADASHELRTPLTAIRGNADLMAIAPLEERDLCLSAIRREAERMSRLVTDLLLLAQADTEEQEIHLVPLDLTALLREVHRSSVILAGERLEVLAEIAEGMSIRGDPDRLKQLVLNLMDNAIKFTPPGGFVHLSAQVDEGEVVIEVADTGIGIPRAEQEAIFERFYRLETARSTRGSGLGLAICSWIVQAHGGRLRVRSAEGKGSTFQVVLPAMISPEKSAPSEPATSPRR